MFSNTAGDATRPPGLLVGVSALTPSANADRNQAAIEDAATLAAAVSTVAANGEIIFICSPKQAVTLRLRTIGFPYLVLNEPPNVRFWHLSETAGQSDCMPAG